MNIANWFTGVVEDVGDPLQQGRVRVRCLGYHTSDTVELPKEDLPWATQIMPVTSPCVSGIGQSATGLFPGSWVFGFFRDSDQQDPVVLASIPGVASANGDKPEGTSSSSTGNAYSGASNSSQYVDGSPVANPANVSALDGKGTPQSQDAANSSGEVNSFVNKVL